MTKQELFHIIADQRKLTGTGEGVIEREKYSEALSKDNFIRVFSGIRRSGKSTLLQYIRSKKPEKDFYVNFDDERLLHFQVDDFQKMHEVFLKEFGHQTTFYFDEIQNIPHWERFVRRLYEEGSKIYITGSNAHLLSKELGTHLTGRYIQTELFPFSFREFFIYREYTFQDITFFSTEEKVRMQKYFSEYVLRGGFPEFLKTENPDYLQSLYESILYRDIIVRHGLPHERTLRDLVLFCASNIGKSISYNKLKHHLGVGSATSVKEYLSYFEDSYLFFTLPKFDYSVKKQLYAPKKIYCIDTGLARKIGFHFTQDAGRYLENVVFLELRRWHQDIFYHKKKNECDFLVREKGAITHAIQVTMSLEDSETKQREIAGLLEAMEAYNLDTGLILTEEEEGEEAHEVAGKKVMVKIVPIWKWLLEKVHV
jgi:hypothetical protein